MRSLLLLLALAASASAQERYALAGDHPQRGPFQVRLLLRRAQDGDLMVELRLKPERAAKELALSGPVELRSPTRIEARLGGASRGLTGALIPTEADARGFALALELEPPGDGATLRLTEPSGEVLVARGARVVEPRPARPTGLKGRLLAVSGQTLEDILSAGPELGGSFPLPVADFLHLGVAARVELLESHQLLPEQETAWLQAQGVTWIETEVEGGLRLPFELPLPVGLRVGIKPGTALRYRVRELHPVPPGVHPRDVKDALVRAGRRAIDLPLTAAEARDLGLGSERVIEGEMSLALSGALGVGTTTAVVSDVVEIGGEARAGGFWRVTGQLRIGVLRCEGSVVRVRWSKVKWRELGAEARAFLGIAGIDRAEARECASGLEYVDPVARVASGLLRFEVKSELACRDQDELDLAYLFDLSRPRAREAYERAVKGDLVVAARAARDRSSGVIEEYRIVDHERRTWQKADLRVSELLQTGASRALSRKELAVADALGKEPVAIARVERKKKAVFLFGMARAEKESSLELVRTGPEGAPGERTLRWRSVVKDPLTSAGEVDRVRRITARWGLPGTTEAELPTPEKRLLKSRWGRTRTLLQVDVAAAGIERLLAAPPAALRQAWARGEALVEGDTVGPRDAESDRARAFAEAVDRLRGDKEAMADGVSALARLAGDDPHAIAAVLELVPPETVRLRAELDGQRVDWNGERRGARFQPGRPLYGH